jgi:sugar/nucleoside kinase (ribokinase family)
MTAPRDCIVCGSCVVDLLCRPVDLSARIGAGVLHLVDPILITGGGITSNAGVSLARMGLRVAVFSYVGRDAWAPVIRNLYRSEGIDDSLLLEHPTGATSTTVVTIDPSGERAFLHCVGAPKLLDPAAFHERMDDICNTRFFLAGYYSLMPNLDPAMAGLYAAMRRRGVRTALDSGGEGGGMAPLDQILPHLDVYVPSHNEAQHQTGESDPRRIIDRYRSCGCPGIVGVKMGTRGVLLSGRAGEYVEISICTPPGPVVDTTGAGDNFYAGLLAGLIKGMDLRDAGRLGAAVAACCVTTVGGSGGGRDYAFTKELAGIA